MDEPRLTERLPPEYQRRREPAWFWAAAFASVLVAIFAGSAISRPVGAVGAIAVAVPFLATFLRHDRQDRAWIIASVRARAHTPDRSDLTGLVRALELTYGERQIAELRDLLP